MPIYGYVCKTCEHRFDVLQKMSDDLKKQTRQIDVATVRGKIDEVALYELLWNPEEATSMLPTIEWENSSRKAKITKASLNLHDKEINIGVKRGEASICIIINLKISNMGN